MQGMACLNVFLIARERFAEQWLGGETRWVLMFIVYSLGFWAIRSLGLWLVWVRVGVLGRKRLGPWAMLLSQNPMHKWIWVPRYRTLAPPWFMPSSQEESRNLKGIRYPRSLSGVHLGGFRNPLMRFQKARYIWPFSSTIIITWQFMNQSGVVCYRRQPKIKPILLKIYVVVRVRIVRF